MLMSGGELVLADATPLAFRSVYYTPDGVGLSGQFARYGAIYKAQLWVYTLVRKRALATMRLPFKVYQREDDGRTDARDSAFARVLRSPNPRMSGPFLWEWTSSTKDVYGEAVWLKVRGRNGEPAELWPVHPSNIVVQVADADRAQALGVPIGSLLYIYAAGLALGADPQFVIPGADVVHFKTYNPDNTLRGLSPIEPLRQTLLNEDAARRATSSFWQNGARPGVALMHKGTLSTPAQQRLKAQWDDLAAGADKTGKTVVLEEGMEPKVMSLTAEEAQYIETRKLNREEACGAYDVPPPVVHILDRATFSNITEQMRSMYRDTMAPHLGGFEATLDFELRPDFSDDTLYGEFLMDEVLRGDFEQRVDAYQKGVNSGWLMPSEVRQMENLPPVEAADRLFVNATLIPIDEVSSRTTANPPALTPAPSSAEVAVAASPADAAAVRALMGRLGRITTLEDIDAEALVAGLNGTAGKVLAELEASKTAGATVEEFRHRVRALVGLRTKTMGAGMTPQLKSLTMTVKAVESDVESGEFEAILSTDAVDREGETVTPGAFNPLPKSIPIHYHHDWTKGTPPIGKGEPYYDGDTLKVKGVYAPTERAQEVRALVSGGFITSMSAGFLTQKAKGKSVLKGDLLEGSFTTTPVNSSALVLASKGLGEDADTKAGARNSASDGERLQHIHDLAVNNGATCAATKSLKGLYGIQVSGSYEERIKAIREELQEQYATDDADTSPWVDVLATTDSTVVFEVNTPGGATETFQADYQWNDGEPTFGTPTEVDVAATVTVEATSSTTDAAAPAATKAAGAAADEEKERLRQRVRAWQMTA